MVNTKKLRENQIVVYLEDYVRNNKGVVIDTPSVPPDEIPADVDIEDVVRIEYRPMLKSRRQQRDKLKHSIPGLNKKFTVVTNTMYPESAVTGPHKVKQGGPHSPDFVVRAHEDIYGNAPYKDEVGMELESNVAELQERAEREQVMRAGAETDAVVASDGNGGGGGRAAPRHPAASTGNNAEDEDGGSRGGGDLDW